MLLQLLFLLSYLLLLLLSLPSLFSFSLALFKFLHQYNTPFHSYTTLYIVCFSKMCYKWIRFHQKCRTNWSWKSVYGNFAHETVQRVNINASLVRSLHLWQGLITINTYFLNVFYFQSGKYWHLLFCFKIILVGDLNSWRYEKRQYIS